MQAAPIARVGQRVWVEAPSGAPASGTVTNIDSERSMITVTLDVEVDKRTELTVPPEGIAVVEPQL